MNDKPLSKRAAKMLERLKAGAFYVWEPDKVPKAMEELEAAGLVGTCGRATRTVRCWVPKGYKPARQERFPGEPDPAIREVLDAQAKLVPQLLTSPATREKVKAGLLAFYQVMTHKDYQLGEGKDVEPK